MAYDEDCNELKSLASSLRAHLELQRAAGTWGLPASAVPYETVTESKIDEASAPPPPHVVDAPKLVDPFTSPVPREPAESPSPPKPTIIHAADVPDGQALVRLPLLAKEVAACTRCTELASTRTQTVFSRGNPEAALCFVGEAPGADEDAQGLPFVGRAGQLLDKMISAMGLDPSHDVYVCNIIKCRPPENRKPTPQETASCIPYLHEQLALIRPKVIVALGNTSVAALLGTKLGITKIRGSWKLYKGSTLVMPTYHPSYLLRPSSQQAEAKKQTWEDLQLVMQELGIPPRKPATR